MASRTARTERFGSGAVYGSLAYDFNNPNLYADIPVVEKPVRTPAAPTTKTRANTAVRTVAVPNKQSVAPGAILGYVCAAVLLVMTLLMRVQIVSVSDASVQLANQLSQLELEQSRLLIEYESAFNLTEIEDYATSVLGMQKPTGDQIYYVDGSAPDKAVIVESGGNGKGLDGLMDSVGEYLG